MIIEDSQQKMYKIKHGTATVVFAYTLNKGQITDLLIHPEIDMNEIHRDTTVVGFGFSKPNGFFDFVYILKEILSIMKKDAPDTLTTESQYSDLFGKVHDILNSE